MHAHGSIDRWQQPAPGPRPGCARVRAIAARSVLAAALWAAGCSAFPPAREPAAPPLTRVWPSPPDPPRLAFVQFVRRPVDLGIRQSRGRRVMNWMTGSDRGNEALVKPFGVALDEHDNLCITDTGTRTVVYVDRVRGTSRRFGRDGHTRFVTPVGVAKRGGTIFVADAGLGAVLALREGGDEAFRITNRLVRPTGVAVSGQEVFVTDARQNEVVVFDMAGRFRRAFGTRGSSPGQFNIPTHIAADSGGRLYVTDSMNGRIQIMAPDGRFIGLVGAPGDAPGYFSRPKGAAVDSAGHIYVVDANFDNIQVFDRQGRVLLAVGGAGGGIGEFWLPGGIAISSQDEIFIADTYNQRVHVLKYVGSP